MIAQANGCANGRLQSLLDLLDGVSSAGRHQWEARCPAHDDNRASLSITETDGKIALKCHANCDTGDVVRAIGWEMKDLFPPRESHGSSSIEAAYDYRDADGSLLTQAVRMFPKDFRQRRPKLGGGWDWSVKGCKVVPYRLPDLLRADPAAPVFIVEGEKDVDNLAKLGIVATCNAGGAGKWRRDHAKYLCSRHVVIVPDNDEAGRKHAEQVCRSLAGIARSVKIVELPGLSPKGDISDWIAAGGNRDELLAIAAKIEPLPVTDSTESAAPRESVTVTALVSPYKPFPVETLPKGVREYVEEASAAIGCDASFIALPLLCCLARAIGNTRAIRLKRTWLELAILWAAIVGKSGTHKTPAMQSATQFLQSRQSKAIAEHASALSEYEIAHALYERNHAEWKRLKTTEPPPAEPEEPHCTRYMTSDATIEAMAGLLAVQFDGLLVTRDELSGWLGGIAEYKGGKGSDLGHWLAAWSGAPLTVDRKTGAVRMIHVPRASVSLVGGIQPAILRASIAKEHMADGLCARLLMAMPASRPVVWSDEAVDWSVESILSGIFDQLLTLEPGTDAEGNFEPQAIDMTPEAKSSWVDYFNRHRAESAGLDDDLAAAWSKLEAYTARFALIFQMCSWAAGEASQEGIDQSSMDSAIKLSDWFGSEAKRIYGLFVESNEERESRELVELIKRKGGSTTARDLARSSRKYRASGAAEEALDHLFELGLGRWVVSPSSTNQRREFVLNSSSAVTVTHSEEPRESSESVTSGGPF